MLLRRACFYWIIIIMVITSRCCDHSRLPLTHTTLYHSLPRNCVSVKDLHHKLKVHPVDAKFINPVARWALVNVAVEMRCAISERH